MTFRNMVSWGLLIITIGFVALLPLHPMVAGAVTAMPIPRLVFIAVLCWVATFSAAAINEESYWGYFWVSIWLLFVVFVAHMFANALPAPSYAAIYPVGVILLLMAAVMMWVFSYVVRHADDDGPED